MPDLLSHAFIGYTLCTVLSWRYEWLTPQYVTVGMAGALIPDITKINLVINDSTVATVLDLPFRWFAVHTLGGTVLAGLVGVTIVADHERRRVAGVLAIGGASHLLADALLVNASGRSYAVLWPLTRWHPPTPGLYLSTDVWPSLLTGAIAVAVWFVTKSRRQPGENP